MSLAAARAEAEAKLAELENGEDPAAVQTIEEQQEPTSVRAVVQEWLTRAVAQTRTKGEVSRIMHKEVIPKWKHKVITDIARPDVLRLLDGIVDRDAPVLANRTLSILKRFFRWTEERGFIELSPVARVRPPAKEKTRDRVLTPEELSAIWNAVPALGYPFGPWIQLLILTAQRRSEVATMCWTDVDLEKAMWTLPAEATKPGRIHDVPLSGAVLGILTGKDHNGDPKVPRFKGDYILTTTSGARPVSGYSKAKATLDAEIMNMRKQAAVNPEKVKPFPRWTYHDLRRTAATWMAKNGVPPHVLAAILNHTSGSQQGITSIYNRFRYTEERRQALEAWAQYVINLTKPAAARVATA